MAGVCGNILPPADPYFQKKPPAVFPPGVFLCSVQACAEPAEEDPARRAGGGGPAPPAPHAARGGEPAPPVALVFTRAAHVACRHTPCVCMSAPPPARNARGSSLATVRISISAPLHPCALPAPAPPPAPPPRAHCLFTRRFRAAHSRCPRLLTLHQLRPPPARRAQAQRLSPPAGRVECCRKRQPPKNGCNFFKNFLVWHCGQKFLNDLTLFLLML